jgi:hypothetical protein
MKAGSSATSAFPYSSPKGSEYQEKWSQKPQCCIPNPTVAMYPATYEVSGLNARATPVTKRLAPNRYMGHSQPSGSGFSPGLTPQSHPLGGSNCDSPWPPCRRVVMERLRAEARGLRAHRTARSGATVCRRMAISGRLQERRCAPVWWFERFWRCFEAAMAGGSRFWGEGRRLDRPAGQSAALLLWLELRIAACRSHD